MRAGGPNVLLASLAFVSGVMATRDSEPPSAGFTTSAEDRRDVARLQARLETTRRSTPGSAAAAPVAGPRVPSVEICEGAHKYVQIRAAPPDGGAQVFVVSRKHAAYHCNAAEPFVARLEQHGYRDIEVTGGGRVALDSATRIIKIYGFSYGFGKPDHSLSADVVRQDERYSGYDVTWSDEGY